MSKQTDVLYGRRGGRMDGTGRANSAPSCEVCGNPMHVGQRKRHAMCSPKCRLGCGWPVDLLGDDHDCRDTAP